MVEKRELQTRIKLHKKLVDAFKLEVFDDVTATSSRYPEQMKIIKNDIINLITDIHELAHMYEDDDELPICAEKGDFDHLSTMFDFAFEELLTLIDERHFIKKIYSDGHFIHTDVRVDK